VDRITNDSICIKELKFNDDADIDLKKYLKSRNACLIQLSDDGYKSMISTMKKLYSL